MTPSSRRRRRMQEVGGVMQVVLPALFLVCVVNGDILVVGQEMHTCLVGPAVLWCALKILHLHPDSKNCFMAVLKLF